MIAQSQEVDTVQTAFRKGRWITGLNGKISSGTTEFDTLKLRSNSYGISVETGKFIADRWFVGLLIEASRQNTEDLTKRESETLFIGPTATRYFSKSSIGSVFLQVTPGYARSRESSEISIANIRDIQDITGSGFGLSADLGYSYVMHDRIAFNIGLRFTNLWINATRTSAITNEITKETLFIGDLSFAFGFSVILDDFFF